MVEMVAQVIGGKINFSTNDEEAVDYPEQKIDVDPTLHHFTRSALVGLKTYIRKAKLHCCHHFKDTLFFTFYHF